MTHQTEGVFWRSTVKPQLDRRQILSKRIESPLTPGFPDVITLSRGIVSLIELKSKLKFEEYFGVKSLQRKFLQDWRINGGKSYALIQIQDWIYFLDGYSIPQKIDNMNPIIESPRKLFDWDRFHTEIQKKEAFSRVA